MHYDVPTGTELYLYIPSGYPREVKVAVNGSSKGGFEGGSDSTYRRIASLGKVTKSDLTLKLTIKNSSNNLYIRQKNTEGKVYDSYIYYIDMDVLGFIDHNITVNIVKDEKVTEKKTLTLPR